MDEVDPIDFGWCINDGHLEPQIQDEEDPLYSTPKEMMTSCACKGPCKKCKCVKNTKIDRKCSRILCKTCECFKKHTNEADSEDLSVQFQLLLDNMSSDESDESELSFHSDMSFELNDEEFLQ